MAELADFAVSAGSEPSVDSSGMSSEAQERHYYSVACFANLKSTATVGCWLSDAVMTVVVVVEVGIAVVVVAAVVVAVAAGPVVVVVVGFVEPVVAAVGVVVLPVTQCCFD